MHKNEHPDGSYPEFRALGKRTIKENPPEEAAHAGGRWGGAEWGKLREWEMGDIQDERRDGETDTSTQPPQLGSPQFIGEQVEAQTG